VIAVDSSAVAAVLFGEDGAEDLVRLLLSDDTVMSAPTRLEIGMVIEARTGAEGVRKLDSLLRTAGIDVVEFSSMQALVALDAFHRFGKGRHRAGLNFGDCISYAIAKSLGVPLLFVGDDFVHTDIRPVR